MKLIFTTFAILLLAALIEAKRSACMCPRNFEPVCGSNGETYSNPCVLRCEAETKRIDLRIVHRGECGVCACPDNLAPVCGSDGKTYDNECTLNCEAETKHGRDIHLTVDHEGVCITEARVADKANDCICPRNFDPVCGTDGETYSNPCLLNCEAEVTRSKGLKMAYRGECQKKIAVKETMCVCPRLMAPVCGTDGETYDNSCLLRCEAKTSHGRNIHLKMAHYGECDEFFL